jgi:putative oxidoreductase
MRKTFTLFSRNWFNEPPANAGRGIDIIRNAVAVIICVHSVHGLMHPADLTDFGQALTERGFPFGVVLAWTIMFVQLFSSVALITGRFVVPGCIGHITVLLCGVAMVHAKSGWFVVGPGENGVEYSVTLIVCLTAVLWAYWPQKQAVAQQILFNN